MERVKGFFTEKRMMKIFHGLAIVQFAILLYRCLGMTWKGGAPLTDPEFVYPIPDSPVLNLLATGALLVVMALLYRVLCRPLQARSGARVWAGLVCIAAMLLAFFWVRSANTTPGADQWMICQAALKFNRGDYSDLGHMGYLAIYPQQLGMVTLLRIVFALFGEGNYRSFQYLMSPCVGLLIFCGFQIVRRLAPENARAHFIYGLLMLTCVPLYAYTPFVYGELPSTALVLLAAWMLMECLEKFHPGKAAVMGLAMGLAGLLRQNTRIMLIAALTVLAVCLLGPRRKRALATAAALLLGTMLPALGLKVFYAPHIPGDATEPMPTILWVAMGTNEELDGWYNYYSWTTYEKYNGDAALCKADGMQVLRDFAERCREDPDAAKQFFYNKMNSQWNAPMYQCLAMNNYRAGPQRAWAQAVYGGYRHWVEGWANLYQNLVYGGVLLVLLYLHGADRPAVDSFLLIGVFGGYLFTAIWEAKTRYVFPYFLFMLPYAAVGCDLAIRWLANKRPRRIRGGAQ